MCGHGVQDAVYRPGHVEHGRRADAAEQIQDEAQGPEPLLPDHGGVDAQDGHPHSDHHGARRRGPSRRAPVLPPQGRVQVSAANEARGLG